MELCCEASLLIQQNASFQRLRWFPLPNDARKELESGKAPPVPFSIERQMHLEMMKKSTLKKKKSTCARALRARL
jgi:hypothetical protein